MATLAGAPVVHALAMHAPGLRQVLELQPVATTGWLLLALLAATVLAVGETYKMLRARPLLLRADRRRRSHADAELGGCSA